MNEIKSRLGVVPQEDGLDQDFTVYENLLLFASYFGIVGASAALRVEEVIKFFKLEDYSSAKAEKLSGGLKRRLAIARGLLNKPEVLVLDEPSAGLDPQSRRWIWDFLHRFKGEMGTLILTTHYMEEAQEICDRIAIMDRSKILRIGEPKSLIESEIGKEVIEYSLSDQDIGYYSNRLGKEGFDHQIINKRIHVHIKKHQESKSVFDVISGSKMTVRSANLSDVFFKLTGHDLREEPL
jgi:lipooligosaccharide transport system ATP-binding protein